MTRGSTCSWVVRAVSRLPPATCVALFRLGFPVATVLRTLTEPLTVTRRIIMQKARRHALLLPAIALRPLVGTWFQVHIPPLTGVLLIFRSLYLFTIGHQGVFSLTGWSPSIQSRFHVTRPTQGTPSTEQHSFRVRACHPLWTTFPDRSASLLFVTPRGPYNPEVETTSVWAVSLSLAATEEIDFSFFSCGY